MKVWEVLNKMDPMSRISKTFLPSVLHFQDLRCPAANMVNKYAPKQVNKGVALESVRPIYQSISVGTSLGTEKVTNTKKRFIRL